MINELCKISNEIANEDGLWDDYNKVKQLKILNPELDDFIVHNVITQRISDVISDLTRANRQIKNGNALKFQDDLVNATISLFDIAYELKIDLEKNIFEALDVEFASESTMKKFKEDSISNLLSICSFLHK